PGATAQNAKGTILACFRILPRRSVHRRTAVIFVPIILGRVGVWRSGGRLNISVAAPFVWRCLTGSTLAPFPHPAHRTGHADFPHPALGQDITPYPRRAATKLC